MIPCDRNRTWLASERGLQFSFKCVTEVLVNKSAISRRTWFMTTPARLACDGVHCQVIGVGSEHGNALRR